MIERGMLVAVADKTVGSSLSVDHVATDVVLRVSDAYPFADGGGMLNVVADDGTATTLAYSGIDDEASTVLLASPLGVASAASTRIVPLPLVRNKVATVLLGDGGPVSVLVPPTIAAFDQLAEGVPDSPLEVEVSTDPMGGYAFTLVSLVGVEATIPSTALTGPAPDGWVGGPTSPPTTAPIVSAAPFAIGTVRVTITPVDPALEATYEVAASLSSPVAENGSATVGTTSGSTFDLAELGGVPLPGNAPTFFKARAVNVIGVGPWSTEVLATPRIIDLATVGDDVLAAIATADAKAVGAQGDADQALVDALAAAQLAQAAQNVADDAIRTWYVEEAPASLNDTTDLGDLWYKLSTDMAYRWAGSLNGGWVMIQDNAIATALANAATAQSAANAAQAEAESKATPENVEAARLAAVNAAALTAQAKADAAQSAAIAAAEANLYQSLNLIDNPTVLNSVGRWTKTASAALSMVDDPADPTLRVMKSTSGAGTVHYSGGYFDVDPSKCYEIRISLKDTAIAAGLQLYFGLYAEGGAIGGVNPLTGAVNAPDTNFYFSYAYTPTLGKYIDLVGYLLPAGTIPEDVIGLGYLGTDDGFTVSKGHAVMSPAHTGFKVRWLNYGNAAASPRDVFMANPSVREVSFEAIKSIRAAQSTADSKASPAYVNTAKAAAISAAATDATNKANTAKADALTAAATDAQAKANLAKSQAIDSAATTAQTKADLAKSQAIADAAAKDLVIADAAAATAQTKADAAQTAAIAAAKTETTNQVATKGRIIPQESQPTGTNANANNLWYKLSTKQVYYYSGSAWILITDPVATQAAAAALAAQQAADAAQAKATTAVTTANGKNRNTYGPTASPSTTGRVDGDMHFVRDAGSISKIQRLVSGAWVDEPVRVEVLAGLDAAYVTAMLITADTFLGRLAAFEEIQTDMLAAGFVAALEIEAQQIKSGAIESDIGLLGRLLVGGYVVIDGGTSSITIYADLANTIPLIQLRPEGSIFRGQVIADDISILNGLILQGVAEITTDAEMILKAGATNPLLGPALDQITLSTPWPAPPIGYSEKGIYSTPGSAYWRRLLVPDQNVPGNCQVETVLNGVVTGTTYLADVPGINETDARGVVHSINSGLYYVAFKNSTGWRVACFSDYDGSYAGITSSVVFADAQATIGYDGFNILLCRSYGSNISVFKLHPSTLNTIWQLDIPRQAGWSKYMYALRYGMFDFTSPKLIIAAGQTARVWDITGWDTTSPVATYNEDETFDLGSSIGFGGFDWSAEDGSFRSVVSGQKMEVYSGSWEGNPEGITVAYADYQNTLHTTVSRFSTAVRGQGRRFIRVTLPPLIGSANTSRVYATRNANGIVVALTSLKRRPEPLVGRSMLYDPSKVALTETPPTTNTFVAGASAVLRSENNAFKVTGNGKTTVPTPVDSTDAANKTYVDARTKTGSTSINFATGGAYYEALVAFAAPMPSIPKVTAFPTDPTFSTVTLNVYADQKTVNGFRLRGQRSGPATIGFDWIAVAT